jgi:hypothetical protein
VQLLPNHAAAELEISKLRDYCLSNTHPRGRHKARVFRASLGISEADATWLKSQILANLKSNEAEAQEHDRFGQRFKVDMILTRQSKKTVIRTIWIVRETSAAPQFLTCWVL